MTTEPLSLACVDGVFDELADNLDHYVPEGSDATFDRDMGRHVYLIASALQAAAADIALALRENPALTPDEIVTALRDRATTLDATSARWFDTYTGTED